MSTRDEPSVIGRAGLILLLTASAAACGDPEPAWSEDAVDLLARRPDALLHQPGELAPDPEDQWGAHDGGGWDRWPSRWDDELYTWSQGWAARLFLPAGAPRDRTVEILAWAPPPADGEPAAPVVATLVLNGMEIGASELELPGRASPVSFEAPAPLWVHGHNTLEFRVDRITKRGPGRLQGLGLAWVRYDEPRVVRVDLASRELRLERETAAVYRIEPLSPSELRIRGRARGAGALDVRFGLLDPATGRTEASSEPPARIEPADGHVAADLPLPDPEGRVVEVELRWTGDGKGSLALERLALLEEEERSRPPIVFVSIDTLAARNMSLYGYARETTPNLDAFAAECVTFARCKSNAPRTWSSYISQFTGLYPGAHQVVRATGEGWRPSIESQKLSRERWTMTEMLRAAGYPTAAWVDNPWITDREGFAQGFDVFDVSAARLAHHTVDADHGEGGIRHVVPLAKEWIARWGPDEPFFAFLQALDVHAPYVPGRRWDEAFAGDGLYDEDRVETVQRGRGDAYRMIPEYLARAVLGEAEPPAETRTAPLATAYDQKILELDSVLGELFDDLRELGAYDRAVIVLSADHGESLLDHDFYFRHGTLYDDTIHVPLLIRLPGGRHGGTRVETAVQLVDLYPTIAEIVGIDAERSFLHGRSLLPALADEPLEPVPLLAEGGLMTQYSLEYDGWKLIESHPAEAGDLVLVTHPRVAGDLFATVPGLREKARSLSEVKEWMRAEPGRKAALEARLRGPFYELYDLRSDPGERTDLSDSEPGRVAALKEMLGAQRARAEAACLADAATTVLESMDEDVKDQLRELGYLGGE